MNYAQIQEAAAYVRARIDRSPKIGIILGTGLGDLAELVSPCRILPYHEIPYFARSTVAGHAGQFVCGALEGAPVIIMQGRLHYYEGHSMAEIVFPVQVMRELGVQTLLITNAAGGINLSYQAGDFMLITDHINLMGTNPLIGAHLPELGPRWCDMTHAYTPALRELARKTAAELGISLKEGVYLACTGPSYETPAEIRAFRTLGADAVGMSTVPEVIAAAHCGMQVLGISLITNMAAGVFNQPLTAEEVFETASRRGDTLQRLLLQIIRKL